MQNLIDTSSFDIVYQNIKQEGIVITRDKLEIVLMKTEKLISHKNGWQTPVSMFFTCLITILTTTFNDWILSASVWYAIFVIVTVICAIWSLCELKTYYKNRKKDVVEEIISRIIAKQDSEANKLDN